MSLIGEEGSDTDSDSSWLLELEVLPQDDSKKKRVIIRRDNTFEFFTEHQIPF